MSTDGSGEECPGPGSTLSYAIVRLRLSGHVIARLAMIAGKVGLSLALARLQGLRLSREWLHLKPQGQI